MCYSIDGITALVKTQFGPVSGFARTLEEEQYSIPWWYWTIRPSELDDYLDEKKRKTARARLLMSAIMMVGRV